MTNMAVREETRPSWTQKTAANDGIKQSDGVVPSSWDDFTKAALSYEYMLNLDYMGSHLKRKKKSHSEMNEEIYSVTSCH